MNKIIGDIEEIITLATDIHGWLKNGNVIKARRALSQIINLDIDELRRIQKEHGDKRLLEECVTVFKLAKRALRGLNLYELDKLTKILNDKIIVIERHELLEAKEDEKIDDFLYDWWYKNIHNGWAYHGTSTIYKDHIRKYGMDPKKRPYLQRVKMFIKIAEKVNAQIEPEHVMSAYLLWNLGAIDKGEMTWTLNQFWAYVDFAGSKRGGEYLKGIEETAYNIIKRCSSNQNVRRLLSEKELSFVTSMGNWATKMRNKGKGLILKVRLSHPAFSHSNITGDLMVLGGNFNWFYRFVKGTLQWRGKWDYNSVKDSLGDKINVSATHYGFSVLKKINPKDIVFVDVPDIISW
jgi:hypothetical protein|tara:strand:+ start:1884 stop:2933 length:1050 start_codon:yes stop_codon:yes gene_type:complete